MAVLDIELRGWDVGFLDLGFRGRDLGFRDLDVEFRAWGFGFWVKGSGVLPTQKARCGGLAAPMGLSPPSLAGSQYKD